jgi:cbb3-type cytochrome oxidase maturation protein
VGRPGNASGLHHILVDAFAAFLAAAARRLYWCPMAAGTVIVGVCALGGLIACAAFWWATRSGEFENQAEARFLVFDDDEIAAAREAERAPGGKA